MNQKEKSLLYWSLLFICCQPVPYLFYKSRTTGEVISRINDLSDIKDVISKLFMTAFVDLVLVVFVFFSLYKINSSLTLIGIVIVILYIIVIKIFNKVFKHYITKNQEDAALVNSYLVECINNIDTVGGGCDESRGRGG